MFFETYRKQRQIRSLEADMQLKTVKNALKTIDSVLEANNIVVDSESRGWNLLGQVSGEMGEESHKNMLASAFNLYHSNPYARSIIRTNVKFTLGQGPILTPLDEKKKKEYRETWDSFKKNNDFNLREKEIAMRTFRDGEVFLRIIKGDEGILIRFIRPSLIANPQDRDMPDNVTHGIETDPDDIETPLFYYKVDGDGDFKEKIPAEEILHVKIFADSDQKRGVSLLRICAKKLAQYDMWLEDRIALNKVRSAIALIRKVDSSAGNIKTIRDAQRSDQYDDTRQKMKLPRSASVITASKGIEYEMLSANINAQDVAEDGRAILLAIATSVGFPEAMLTSDWSASNYASTLIAQNPFVREIEDWQDFFTGVYKKLYYMVIEDKFGESANTDCEIKFPPMISADLEKLARAYEILFKYKVISKKSWRGEMGLDHELESIYTEEEEEETDALFNPNAGQLGPGGKPTGQGSFNLPAAPVNQYNSLQQEMYDAFREFNWDRVIELAEENAEKEGKKSKKVLEAEEKERLAEEKQLQKELMELDKKQLLDIFTTGQNMTLEGMKDMANAIREQKQGDLYIESAPINIGETVVNIPKQDPTVVNITNQQPEVKITNEGDTVNITQPDIIIPKQDPSVVNVSNPITVDVPIPNVVVENKIDIPTKIKTKKTIKRDEQGEIISIEESSE